MLKSLEIAVFDVDAPAHFDALQRGMHARLATYEGFIAALPLKGHHDTRLRADVVLWASHRAARAAAEAMKKDPAAGSFMAAIAKIRVFAHYAGVEDVEVVHRLSEAPLIELAGYHVGGDEGMGEVREKIHGALTQSDGVVTTIKAVLRGDESEAALGAIDVIGWTSQAAHDRGPEVVMASFPELAPMFEADPADHPLFALFEVVR